MNYLWDYIRGLEYSVWKALTDEKAKKCHFGTSVLVKIIRSLLQEPPRVRLTVSCSLYVLMFPSSIPSVG